MPAGVGRQYGIQDMPVQVGPWLLLLVEHLPAGNRQLFALHRIISQSVDTGWKRTGRSIRFYWDMAKFAAKAATRDESACIVRTETD